MPGAVTRLSFGHSGDYRSRLTISRKIYSQRDRSLDGNQTAKALGHLEHRKAGIKEYDFELVALPQKFGVGQIAESEPTPEVESGCGGGI